MARGSAAFGGLVRSSVCASRAATVRDDRNRRERHDAPQSSHRHGAAFGAGGVTFVNGSSGLLIRSSFPAGTMLITMRAAER